MDSFTTAKFELHNHHFVRNVFLKPETQNLHCFATPPQPPKLAHFDTEANKYVAEDIYEHIKDDLISDVKTMGSIVKSYFDKYSRYKKLSDRVVADYLSDLYRYAKSGNNGFICLKNKLNGKDFASINRALIDVEHLYLHVHFSQNVAVLKDWISKQGLENEIDLLPEKKLKKKCYIYGYKLRATEEDFCPIDDMYIFSNYIANEFNVKKYFMRECDFAEHREYLMVHKEYLKRVGVDVVVINDSTCVDD